MKSFSKPTILLRDGVIHTLDERTPKVQSLAIDRECISAIGANDDISILVGPQTEVVNLEGRTVLPGFVDAHIHLESYALNLDKVDCEAPRLETCLERVRVIAERASPGDWILGHGWNQNDWDRYGTSNDLDLVAPHNPVYLTAKSLHAGWANSRALKFAHVEDSTPDPSDGYIQRNADGIPTGILFEGAMRLMADAVPPTIGTDIAAKLIGAQEKLWRYGITGVHDFDGPRCMQALQLLHDRGELGLRVVKNIQFDELEYARDLGLHTDFGDPWIRIGNLKIFADGALGPHTAAMITPYNGEPENTGVLFYDRGELFELFVGAVEAGFALAVHAIGDRANHIVLNAFEELRLYEVEHNHPRRLHRIEHLQLLHSDDVTRPATLDIIASMQPIHAISDMKMAKRYWGSRSQYAYAWRSQLNAGGRLVFGSDAPVESPNPFWGLHAAITRHPLDGSPGSEGWIPKERLDLRDALRAYIQAPAHAVGLERNFGRLAQNFAADLIVLEANPLECSPEELADLKPVGTMVGGVWRYRAF